MKKRNVEKTGKKKQSYYYSQEILSSTKKTHTRKSIETLLALKKNVVLQGY